MRSSDIASFGKKINQTKFEETRLQTSLRFLFMCVWLRELVSRVRLSFDFIVMGFASLFNRGSKNHPCMDLNGTHLFYRNTPFLLL